MSGNETNAAMMREKKGWVLENGSPTELWTGTTAPFCIGRDREGGSPACRRGMEGFKLKVIGQIGNAEHHDG
jgi:hypothetical protein